MRSARNPSGSFSVNCSRCLRADPSSMLSNSPDVNLGRLARAARLGSVEHTARSGVSPQSGNREFAIREEDLCRSRNRTAGPGRAARAQLEALGAVPLRAAVGHGPRGLFRRTATAGTTSRTITPAAAPTAGARTACWASCDRECRLCFALALWNGRDPILKERLFGLTGPEGQPRRGREGVLLLPRLDADALVHEGALQVSAGRVSVRAAGRGEPPPRARRRRSSSSPTPASSTTTATSTCSPSTPRRRPTTS